MESFVDAYIQDHLRLLASLPAAQVAEVIDLFKKAREADKRIFAIGNGGSASTASHFATDLGKGASLGRKKRFKVASFTDNVEWITALGNDLSYQDVFVEQLKNFAEPGDLLLAISGSGNSENVLRAVRYANEIGCQTIGFAGFKGGKLKELARHCIVVDSDHMGRIEDIHLMLQHMVCYYFMEKEKEN